MDCVWSLQFWPFLAIQGGLFYFAVLTITLLKSQELFPEHTGFDERWGNTFFVAWHFPNIFSALPISIMGLSAFFELWSADPKWQYGTGCGEGHVAISS